MRIGEVISKCNLSKKTIHYYVQVGLISPKQEENGYYDFSDADISQLETIKKMRYLGLSIDSLRLILNDPSLAFYYLIKQRKSLQKELELLQWKTTCISDLLENLDTGISSDVLSQRLDKTIRYYPEKNPSDIIDLNDAELLAYFFWGRYMGKTEMTEYQKFLWEKLKKSIVLNQVASTCRLRDSLYQFQKDHVEEAFYNYCDEKLASEIASLSMEDIPKFVEYLILRAQEHLKDTSWVLKWKQNKTYIIDTGYFFDSDPSTIMCEMSPFFANYKNNINQCGELLWDYMSTKEGHHLLDWISKTLSSDLDLDTHHHATLIGICLWD